VDEYEAPILTKHTPSDLGDSDWLLRSLMPRAPEGRYRGDSYGILFADTGDRVPSDGLDACLIRRGRLRDDKLLLSAIGAETMTPTEP